MREVKLVVGVEQLQPVLGLLPSTVRVVRTAATLENTNTAALVLWGDFPDTWKFVKLDVFAGPTGISAQLARRPDAPPSLYPEGLWR